MAKRVKQRKLTSRNGMEMLVNKVELNQKLLLGSLIAGGITNKRKLAAWEKMTDAVNSVWSEERTLSGVMRRPK